MGNYITHTVGTTAPSTLELFNYMSEETLSILLKDLETTAKKQAAIDDAIDGAEGMIDSYMSGRYDIPIVTVTRAVKDAAGSMSICNLYGRGARGAPQAIQERCDEAKEWLKDVSNSKAHIVGATAQPEPPGGGSVATVSANTREMTRDKLVWW